MLFVTTLKAKSMNSQGSAKAPISDEDLKRLTSFSEVKATINTEKASNDAAKHGRKYG